MPTLDEQIALQIRADELSGAMSQAPSFGRPLQESDGFMETPEELRMGYKILKDAGYVPPEVALMQEVTQMRQALQAASPAEEAELRRQLVDLELRLTLSLERLPRI